MYIDIVTINWFLHPILTSETSQGVRLAHRGICERTSAQSYAHVSNLSHEANMTCLSNTAQHKYQCDLHMCLRHTHPNPAIIMPVAQVSPLTSHLPHLKQLILVGNSNTPLAAITILHPSRRETTNTSVIELWESQYLLHLEKASWTMLSY